MSLDHILLGLLREPRSGYDLKTVFDETATHFWPVELSHIYRILKRLEAEGLLKSRHQSSPRGPDRRIYRLTPSGRRRLRTWLSGAPILNDERFTFIAQIFFMGELDDLRESRRFVEQLRAMRLAQREALLRIERQLLSDAGGSDENFPDEEFHQYLTLRSGINTTTARIQWCDETLARIDRRIKQKDDNAKKPRRRRTS